jgi:hypothetical protein
MDPFGAERGGTMSTSRRFLRPRTSVPSWSEVYRGTSVTWDWKLALPMEVDAGSGGGRPELEHPNKTTANALLLLSRIQWTLQ